jgi:hypothetical protein
MATNITLFSNRVAPDVMGCPRTLIDSIVVDTIINFCKETQIIEKGFEHDVVTADIIAADNDSVNVDLSTLFANLRPVLLTEFKINGSPWDAQEIKIMNDMDDLSEISIQGTKFFTYPDRTHIKFYGIDAEDQTFWIKQVYVPLDTITTIDDFIYDDFHKAIEAGAKAEIMAMPKKDWSNPAMVGYYRGLYTDGVVLAKIRMGKGQTRRSTAVKSTRWF